MAKLNRRRFISKTGSMAAGAGLLQNVSGISASEPRKYGNSVLGEIATSSPIATNPITPVHVPRGKADSCIFIWLGGGACHVDTFDPKRIGDSKQKSKKPGSAYRKISTAIDGQHVCEHLPNLAPRFDKGVIVRSVHHDVIDEHAAATNRMHVGRPATGTTQYPSIGSMVVHERPTTSAGVPGYVLMGYPSATRGPGFLGSKNGYIYLTDTKAGPSGLRLPIDVNQKRMSRRERLLKNLATQQAEQSNSAAVRDQLENSLAGLKLAGPKFMKNFDLTSESSKLRNAYGGEFGQRCLLARRLVQSGVRFIEVGFNLNFINGTGWDTHNEGQENQHVLIQQLDKSVATLIDDLEKQKILDSTLVVITTEFGRPPEFDGGGGRGHQSTAFSSVFFGGGMKTGQVVGETDDLGKKIVANPVSIADFHASIFHTMGIDHETHLYDGDRPVPLTDRGTPIKELF